MIKGIVYKFEDFIVLALLVMMTALLASTIELGILLVQQLREPPVLLLDVKEMLEVFSLLGEKGIPG